MLVVLLVSINVSANANKLQTAIKMKVADLVFCIFYFVVLLVQVVQPLNEIKTSKQKKITTTNSTKTVFLNQSHKDSPIGAKQNKNNFTAVKNITKATILNHSNTSLINPKEPKNKASTAKDTILTQIQRYYTSLINPKKQKKNAPVAKTISTKNLHSSVDLNNTKKPKNVSETSTAKATISNQTHPKPSSNLKDQLKTVSEYDETVYDPSLLDKKIGLIKHDIGKRLMTSLSSELSKREYEKEDSEFEQKLQKEQEASKEEEKAFNRTNKVLDQLGMLRSAMNSIVDDPIQSSEPVKLNINHPVNSSVRKPSTLNKTATITDDKKHKLLLNLTTERNEPNVSKYEDKVDDKTTENPFKFLNLDLTVEKSNTPENIDKTNKKQQDEITTSKKSPPSAEEIYRNIFLNQVKSETRKKETSGHKDILPVYLTKQEIVESSKWKPFEDNRYHFIKPDSKVDGESVKNHQNGVLAAEYIDDDDKLLANHKNTLDGGSSHQNDGSSTLNRNSTQQLQNSTVLHHLTAGVLNPADIEKTSAQFAVANASAQIKPAVRIHLNQIDTRKKMFFTKAASSPSSSTQVSHKTNTTTTGAKSKVTVFGADDIDLETSTPNFAENIIDEVNKSLGVQEYAVKEKPTVKESDDIDRLKTMEAEIKTTRAKLHVRGFIPRTKTNNLQK